MNLVDYINENTGIQRGDEIHDSFVRFLSEEEILKSLGITPPYHARGFEVKASNSGRKRGDLIIFNNELVIIEAKVIRSLDPKMEIRRIKDINNQLKKGYSYFNKKKIETPIKLIGAYKLINEQHFNFYILPPSGLKVDSLEISQVPCL
jgi:hypothetical protein